MKILKFYLLAAVFMTISLCIKGQEECLPNYDFYIGTWIYKTANEEFILKIRDQKEASGNARYFAIGTYKYVKNGDVIYDFLSSVKREERVAFLRIERLPSDQEHKKLEIMYRDPKSKQKSGRKSTLSIYSKNPDKLKWHLVFEDWEPDFDFPFEFTIPYDMILTKVEE